MTTRYTTPINLKFQNSVNPNHTALTLRMPLALIIYMAIVHTPNPVHYTPNQTVNAKDAIGPNNAVSPNGVVAPGAMVHLILPMPLIRMMRLTLTMSAIPPTGSPTQSASTAKSSAEWRTLNSFKLALGLD